MEEADPTTAAEVALMMEQEIDRRVAQALERILEIPYLPPDDEGCAKVAIVNALVETMMTNYEFQRRVANMISDKLRG